MKAARTFRMLLALPLVIGLLVSACSEEADPRQNTPTSGELRVFVDEPYLPLISALADSFMQKAPDARVQIEALPARRAIEALLNTRAADTAWGSDTLPTAAAIVARRLLPDEEEIYRTREFNLMEYLLAWDGIVVLASEGLAGETTLDSLLTAVMTEGRRGRSIGAPSDDPVRLVIPDQSSSVYHALRMRYLDQGEIAGPVTYVESVDSVIAMATEPRTLGFVNWYATVGAGSVPSMMEVGYTDSSGQTRPPTVIHPSTLVTEAYPLKQPLYGYTFAHRNSLAHGFLAWLSGSQVAQEYLANAGLQPENLKLRLVIDE